MKKKQCVGENNIEESSGGKKYRFTSAIGQNMLGIFNSRITSDVEMGEDRLLINISPKRLNKVSAILYEDITGIDIARYISIYFWGLIIISAIGAIKAPYCLVCTLILIFCGLQKKITISQRNGEKVVIYSSDKKKAEEFKEDMKSVVKTQ